MADKFPDDPLDALNFSIDDEDLEFTPKKTVDHNRAASLFGIGDDSKKAEPELPIASGPMQPRKRGGSGDWLGLRDPSPLDFLDDDVKPQSAKTAMKPIVEPPAQQRAKTADESKKPAPAPMPKAPVRKRNNILDDMFGDTSFNKEKPKTPLFSSVDTNLGAFSKPTDDSYLPSLSEKRRPGDRKAPSTPKTADLGDWLLEPKDRSSKTAVTIKDLPKTSTPLTTPNPSKKGLPKELGGGLPSWLSSGFNDTTLPEPSTTDERATTKSEIGAQPSTALTTTHEASSVQQTAVVKQRTDEGPRQPSANPGGHMVAPEQPTFIYPSTVFPQPVYVPAVPPATGDLNPNIIGQLNSMHAQIGAAMVKHQQNLLSYMQAISVEAQRVGLTDQIPVTVQKDKAEGEDSDEMDIEKGSENTDEDNTKIKRKSKTKKDSKTSKIKRQELEIQEMEIQISKLEIQVAQLELKIASIEEVKTLEIESLKKTHAFEIAAWESRYERAKENYDEIAKEYEEKISKLKKKVEELEAQHKDRVEVLQSERMSDLEKLGEFHRVALEQAASITLPQASGLGAMRLPMKILQKPGDETELEEREAALIEKEKQIEMLRQSLEIEKLTLDETKEKEKVKKEEREREMRRVLIEAQLKDEMLTKEYQRRKDQMDAQQAQIEKMREDALKEQAELTREKLALAAEKAKMEAVMSLERTSESPQLQPLDMMRARAELEAALEGAREAREAADRERRRHVELRKAVEETTWDQKDKDQQLQMRERHVANMLKEAEAKKFEADSALDKAQTLNEEMEAKQREVKEHLRQIETKEKVLAAERMQIAREKVELEKKKAQLEVLLPELSPAEDLVVQGVRSTSSHKDYVDPKALIMRLKAEKDLQQYIVPTRSQSQRL